VGDDDFSVERELPEQLWAVAYPATTNQAYTAAFAALDKGVPVRRLTQPFGDLPAGSFIIGAGSVARAELAEVVAAASLTPQVLDSEVTVGMVPVRNPRVALVETHFHDMDAGWTRYLFDIYGLEYTVLHPEDFEGADLARDFDVIVFPDASKDVLVKGKYKRYGRYMSNDYPPEFRKPISAKARARLTDFITGGGVVVSWGQSVGLFTEGLPLNDDNGGDDTLELPVRDLTDELDEVSVPGAFLAVDFVSDHPLTWGLPEHSGAFTRGRPVFATSIPVLDTDRRVVGIYPERDLLISGYLEGEKQLQNRANTVWLRAGKGQLVLFGIQPQFRGGTPATFKLVFNAVLLPPVGD
jgi:hypothetical protein